MRKILIIGKNSYIGKNIRQWLGKYPDQYIVDAISVRDDRWKLYDFSKYDTVVNLVGIAHINNITPDMRELFYSVNRDLVIALGKHAKSQGVHHFIHFSSMNVYGDYCDNIFDRNAVNPTNFYGDSKLQGDIGLAKLENDKFKISFIRPPFVYGKGCSGNYNSISKIAKKIPIFPDYPNKKSMIYIDNLCEFVRLVIEEKLNGYLTPQNKELISTTDLVRAISEVTRHRIIYTRLFNLCIWLGNKFTKKIRRAFANDCYRSELSNYFEFKYCLVSFEESIKLTESK